MGVMNMYNSFSGRVVNEHIIGYRCHAPKSARKVYPQIQFNIGMQGVDVEVQSDYSNF